MKTIEFNDSYCTKLKIQHSSAADESYWIFIEGKDFPEQIDEVSGQNIPNGIHLRRNQAEMLINALQDLFQDSDQV